MEKKISDGGRELSGWQKIEHLDIYEDQIETLSVSSAHTNISLCFSVWEGEALWEKGGRGNAGFPLSEEKILDTNQ